jgi:hypothetical protein
MLTTCSIPVFLEHRQNFKLLKDLPPDTLDWSMLCPYTMTPESSDFNIPTNSSKAKLVANAGSPPLWQGSWIENIPLIGQTIYWAMNSSRYVTTLEQNAEFIANDLESYESKWSEAVVGIIDPSK